MIELSVVELDAPTTKAEQLLDALTACDQMYYNESSWSLEELREAKLRTIDFYLHTGKER